MNFYKKTAYSIIILLLLLTGCGSSSDFSGTSTNGSPLGVEEALSKDEGKEVVVQGYVTGQPVSTSNVAIGNFSNDYALALADSADENNKEKMIFIQIPAEFREQYGLKSNPDLMEKGVIVTGKRESYFAHAGIKSVDSLELIQESEEPDEEVEDPPAPPEIKDPYYEEASGKTGVELKKALHEIIDDHRMLTYAEVWTALRETDKDPDNPDNVILLYTGRSQSKLLNGGGADDWNREHVWAKSHGGFGTSKGAGTDLHHLRPTDTTVNSSRSNLDFDNGGSPHKEAKGNFYDNDSWEPRDEVKGDVARMLFYMAVRYEGDSGELDLELNDRVENGSNPLHGKSSVLIDWHLKDPVDENERRRNEIIFEKYQGNRNPFIDHPEWAQMIW
ncbi:ribonuclease [Bacillus salacetis]|uniref:Ribonuclease n=1 Tax=Bacillus salacetis TaxID=2315464 RepID=A0A3A1R653_9BACI|nr:endonuclease [Bacillus salacetis]RIW38485.1 ribonuclease [Bacillus salacetis]